MYFVRRENLSKLQELKSADYLTCRIFHALVENLHYEILKYLSFTEALKMRLINSGGYQIMTNRKLRGKFCIFAQKPDETYLKKLLRVEPGLSPHNLLNRWNFLLDFGYITKIVLSNYFISLYYIDYIKSGFGSKGASNLSPYLQKVPQLQTFIFGIYIIC